MNDFDDIQNPTPAQAQTAAPQNPVAVLDQLVSDMEFHLALSIRSLVRAVVLREAKVAEVARAARAAEANKAVPRLAHGTKRNVKPLGASVPTAVRRALARSRRLKVRTDLPLTAI